jgi:hypothetical protein
MMWRVITNSLMMALICGVAPVANAQGINQNPAKFAPTQLQGQQMQGSGSGKGDARASASATPSGRQKELVAGLIDYMDSIEMASMEMFESPVTGFGNDALWEDQGRRVVVALAPKTDRTGR